MNTFKDKYPNAFQDFFQGYIDCALWAESADIEPELDESFADCGFSVISLTEETRKKMEDDCEKFLQKAENLLDEEKNVRKDNFRFDIAGQDFWLTRNGHGAGFWDGGWHYGKELTEIANEFPECTLYLIGNKITI
ncbi:MAG: hypothetical protein ACOCUT_00090 [bacterium]